MSPKNTAKHGITRPVIRAGRNLTKEDYERYEGITGYEDIANYKGEGSHGRVQLRFLGGYGGIRILGESPG
jgi:hypothetical protein